MMELEVLYYLQHNPPSEGGRGLTPGRVFLGGGTPVRICGE